MDAADVRAYLDAQGVPFNVADKVEQAESYTNQHFGSSLAVPSKLYGTAQLQDRLARVAADAADGPAYRLCRAYVVDGFEGQQILVSDVATGQPVGLVQRKHVGWLAPLLDFGAAVFVTAVTGGEGHKFFGCNVAFVGVADAIRAMNRAADEAARAAAQEEAYEAGDPTRVLALTEAAYRAEEAEATGHAACACGDVMPAGAEACADCEREAVLLAIL